MPDRELLRQYLKPQPAVPRPVPVPTAPPPSPERKDRISIGAPSDVRQKQLILRRDEDLVTPKGRPDAAPSVKPPEPQVPPSVSEEGTRTARSSEPVIGGQAPPVAPGRETPSIAGSLRNLERQMASGPRGLPTGAGQQMGPLFFDPEGADFTVWLDRFKNEVYRNWLIPNAVLLGIRGHVDLEFTVERDGSVTGLKLVKSIGNAALDKAAANAILAGRFLPLPSDFAPPRVTMQVSFYYGEGPQG